MVGWDLVVGYLAAWAAAKARRVGAQLDDDVDQVMDAGLDRLHDLIMEKLGPDPALEKLELEAATVGTVSERTQRRVVDALADAEESDPGFARRLTDLLAEFASHRSSVLTQSEDHSVAAGGNVMIHAESGSVAAAVMGDVSVDGSRTARDPQGPGRPSD